MCACTYIDISECTQCMSCEQVSYVRINIKVYYCDSYVCAMHAEKRVTLYLYLVCQCMSSAQ